MISSVERRSPNLIHLSTRYVGVLEKFDLNTHLDLKDRSGSPPHNNPYFMLSVWHHDAGEQSDSIIIIPSVAHIAVSLESALIIITRS